MADEFLNILVWGLANGSTTALLAMGFSLVYGVGGILNQAHGAFYALIGYLAVNILSNFAADFFFWAMIIGMIIVIVISALAYQGLIKEVQDNIINVLIVTLAISMFIENYLKVYWGTEPVDLPRLVKVFPDLDSFVDVFGLAVPTQVIFQFIVATITLATTLILVSKSKLGQSIRAVSQDREAAELMGINANSMLMVTIAISIILSAIAAMVVLPIANIYPNVGNHVLINAFAVTVIGGLGSLGGSVVAAYILSFASRFVGVMYGEIWISYVPIFAIIIILLIRPQGLFGKKERS